MTEVNDTQTLQKIKKTHEKAAVIAGTFMAVTMSIYFFTFSMLMDTGKNGLVRGGHGGAVPLRPDLSQAAGVRHYPHGAARQCRVPARLAGYEGDGFGQAAAIISYGPGRKGAGNQRPSKWSYKLGGCGFLPGLG